MQINKMGYRWKSQAFLCLVSLALCVCHGSAVDLPFETADTLFDVEDRVKIDFLKDPVPLYRKDLDPHYVAYWQFTVNQDEQLIVSAGPNTGDYKLVHQGPLPSMTKLLDRTAWEHGQKCHRYYMLAPEVTLMCEDETGHVVATSSDSYIKYEGTNTSETTLRYRYIEDNVHKVKEEWVKRAREVKEDGIWGDITVVPVELSQQTDHEELDNGGLFILHPGQIAKIPYTDIQDTRLSSPDSSEHRLCELFQVCTADNTGVVKTNMTEKNAYGISYVALTVPEKMHEKHIRFNLHIKTKTSLVVKRFYIDFSRRSKRATYTSWKYVSIGHESLFPDYNQFKTSKCQVGCGPVAWAMIFGYYDRRSHQQTSTYGSGSQKLYRCGADGTTGSASCVAPKNNDARVRKYIVKLKGILKTFCISGEGATLHGNMDRVEGFFKSRQSGSPDIVLKRPLLGLFGVYSKKTRDKAIAALKAGWPVIAGIRVSGLFSQHYPVATKYRSRVKTEKKCFLWKCWNKKTTQYEMYLHMGWGGSKNGWRTAKMFFAGYAKY